MTLYECVEKHDAKNRLFNVKDFLCNLDMFELWENKKAAGFFIVKQHIFDQARQDIISQPDSTSKCTFQTPNCNPYSTISFTI